MSIAAVHADHQPLWSSLLLVTPAAVALTGAVAVQRCRQVGSAWRLARLVTLAMMAAAVGAAVARAAGQDRADALLRTDAVGVAMGCLVGFVGWVVVTYSRSYLAGDPREQVYISRLLTTVGAVTVVVVTNHLAVLLVAWAATSIALHGLLTHFSGRPVAVTVAHKKFILARSADLALVGAAAAFWSAFSTLRIDRIAAEAAAGNLPAAARIGVALVAVAALLKCAQLPFHGWLIQVMEAPTPVSALLHAGVVNLGGFVLLRFAPVVDAAVETRTLLVVVGTVTAVVASLVMTTRISIKVSLAWSTCAQMGFMVVQCGLGLWEMAMVHLLAHSLYKAHAFLGAGGVVRQTQRKQLAPHTAPAGLRTVALGTLTAVAMTLAAGWVWGRLPSTGAPSAALWVAGAVVALALVPLLAVTGRPAARTTATLAVSALAVPMVYFGLHEAFTDLVGHGAAAPTALVALVAVAFGALFVAQQLCVSAPDHHLVQRMYPWVYGGLFVDEAFTRTVLRLWPPPAPSPDPALLPVVTATVRLPSAAAASTSPQASNHVVATAQIGLA